MTGGQGPSGGLEATPEGLQQRPGGVAQDARLPRDPLAPDYLQATGVRPASPVGTTGKIALQTTFQKGQSTRMAFIGQDDGLQPRGMIGAPDKIVPRFAGGTEINLDEQRLKAMDPEQAAKSYKPQAPLLRPDPGSEHEQYLHQETAPAADRAAVAVGRGPPQQVEREPEYYADKLVDEVNNAKLGSPLRVAYADSPVHMYQ